MFLLIISPRVLHKPELQVSVDILELHTYVPIFLIYLPAIINSPCKYAFLATNSSFLTNLNLQLLSKLNVYRFLKYLPSRRFLYKPHVNKAMQVHRQRIRKSRRGTRRLKIINIFVGLR